MPRYFFHVRDGLPSSDTEGTELPDIYAAQANAVRLTGEELRDLGPEFWNSQEFSVRVTDAQGRTLFVIKVSAEEISFASEMPIVT